MTAYQIAYNLAVAIITNESIQDLAVELFGQRIKVFMDSTGTAQQTDFIDEFYPQLIISGSAENGGEVADGKEFEILARLLVDASLDTDGTDVDTSKAMRDENGIFIYARGESLSRLTNAITAALPNFTPGANFQTSSVDYENGAFYPIQYSDFTINYKSYRAFGDSF